MKLQRCALTLVAFTLLLTPAGLQAADDPIDVFTSDAALLIRLKNPQATVEKIATAADKIQEGFGTIVRGFLPLAGQTLQNPTLQGVDMQRDWWVCAYARADGQPGMIYAIPTTNVAELRESIVGDVTFIEHETWGIYTGDEQLAAKVTDRIAGKGTSLASVIDGELKSAFSEGDFSIFINVPELIQVYGEQLSEKRDELEDALATQPSPIQPILQVYLGIADQFLQAGKDANGSVLTLTINEQGAALESFLRVKPASETDKLFSVESGSEHLLISRLPQNAEVYYATGGGLQQLLQLSAKMVNGMQYFGQKPDPERAEKSRKAIEGLAGLKYRSIAGAVAVDAEEGGGIQSMGITEVAQPQKYRQLFGEYFESQPELDFGGISIRYESTKDAEKYGDHSGDTMEVIQESTEQAFFSMEEFYRMMYGDDGMLTRIVALDSQVVQTVGGGRELMERTIKAAEAPTASKPTQAYLTTRSQLSPKPDLLALVNIPGLVTKVIQLFSNGEDFFPFPFFNGDAFQNPVQVSYLGISFATKPQSAHLKLYLPIAQAKTIYEMVQNFQAMSQIEADEF